MKKSARRHDPDMAMLGYVGKYLERNGWHVVVIGSPRVQQPLTFEKYNYEFVLKFSGSQKQPKPPDNKKVPA